MCKQSPILVVEDDPNDAFLLERALIKAQVSAPIHFFRDGQEVLDYLQGIAAFGTPTVQPLPGLLLLDLKMPLIDGFEVLQWLRARPVFDSMRVIILSGLEDQASIERACALGADDYWLKPKDPTQLVRLLRHLTQSPGPAAQDLAPTVQSLAQAT
ncbi:MAG TPA: response regulator [Bacillota bacterium]|nr:response regulator [Bacillota bacterium]